MIQKALQKNFKLIFLFLLVAIGSSCSAGNNPQEGTMIKKVIKQGAILLDVRSQQEFQREHVKGSINIPVAELEDNLERLKGEKKVVVYCESGMRSMKAKDILEKNGYSGIVNARSWRTVKLIVKEIE